MGNLPFERTRYNPVQETTPEEAEKNKQRLNIEEAARKETGEQAPDPGSPPGPEHERKDG